MYKFLLYTILISLIWFAYMNQISYHAAQIQYYKFKYAVNRAAHAATLQLDRTKLAEGLVVIDEQLAYEKAVDLLKLNLDTQQYSLRLFEVVQMPAMVDSLHYTNEEWDIDIILYEPAVIVLIEAKVPHFLQEHRTMNWEIYGTSQVIHSFK